MPSIFTSSTADFITRTRLQRLLYGSPREKKLLGPFFPFLDGKDKILSSYKQQKLCCSFEQHKIMSRSIFALQRTENIEVPYIQEHILVLCRISLFNLG